MRAVQSPSWLVVLLYVAALRYTRADMVIYTNPRIDILNVTRYIYLFLYF